MSEKIALAMMKLKLAHAEQRKAASNHTLAKWDRNLALLKAMRSEISALNDLAAGLDDTLNGLRKRLAVLENRGAVPVFAVSKGYDVDPAVAPASTDPVSALHHHLAHISATERAHALTKIALANAQGRA